MIERELDILKKIGNVHQLLVLMEKLLFAKKCSIPILEKLRKLDDEDLVKELSKLSKEDRWYLCPYVIDELAYDDGRKVAEPFIVE